MEKINHEEISSALMRKNITQVCPMCGKHELTGIREEEIQLMSFTHPQNGAMVLTGTTMIPCAALVCQNCGYVAHFTLQSLLK